MKLNREDITCIHSTNKKAEYNYLCDLLKSEGISVLSKDLLDPILNSDIFLQTQNPGIFQIWVNTEDEKTGLRIIDDILNSRQQ